MGGSGERQLGDGLALFAIGKPFSLAAATRTVCLHRAPMIDGG
jgi:hypothetical protein